MNVPLSLIIPSRGRVSSLQRLLERLAALATGSYEVVLVVDEDDVATRTVERAELNRVVVPPGLTMGALNDAGCQAASGEFVMLLNDDVIPRTPGWDARLLAAARNFTDGISLVHANDTLMKEHLCVFPMLPRGLIAIPHAYCRYRIDDHIQHVFDIMAAIGERRTIWLPDVIFEHLNGVNMASGAREYHAEPVVLAKDALVFDALAPQRQQLALDLITRIIRNRIDALPDAFSLRRSPSRPSFLERLVRTWRTRGMAGLMDVAIRRIAGRNS